MRESFLKNWSKPLHHEALGGFDEPKSWEIREINEIMNQSVTGWIPYPNPRSYKKYGKQRGWMRGNEVVETGTSPLDGFRELTEEECNQMELPFWERSMVSCLISNPLPYRFPWKALFCKAFSSLETKATKKCKKNQNSKDSCRQGEIWFLWASFRFLFLVLPCPAFGGIEMNKV